METTVKFIKAGDRVKVYWENVEWIEGIVLYIPQSDGDSYIIESDDKLLHHVQHFCRITKVS